MGVWVGVLTWLNRNVPSRLNVSQEGTRRIVAWTSAGRGEALLHAELGLLWPLASGRLAPAPPPLSWHLCLGALGEVPCADSAGADLEEGEED